MTRQWITRRSSLSETHRDAAVSRARARHVLLGARLAVDRRDGACRAILPFGAFGATYFGVAGWVGGEIAGDAVSGARREVGGGWTRAWHPSP
jgi:hypothetical protein